MKTEMKTMRRVEMMTRNSRDRRKSHAVRLLYIPDLQSKVYLVQIYLTTPTICNTFSSGRRWRSFNFNILILAREPIICFIIIPRG